MLLSNLLQKDPSHRFDADQALNHTFFDSISKNDTNLQLKTGSAKKTINIERFIETSAFDSVPCENNEETKIEHKGI